MTVCRLLVSSKYTKKKIKGDLFLGGGWSCFLFKTIPMGKWFGNLFLSLGLLFFWKNFQLKSFKHLFLIFVGFHFFFEFVSKKSFDTRNIIVKFKLV